MSDHEPFDPLAAPLTRRTLLKRAGVGGVAILGGTLWRTAPAAARARRVGQVSTPLRHVILAAQENRSFDHYFGYSPQAQAAGFGPPAGYFQPDSAGGRHEPFELTALSTPDPPHGWTSVHRQWDGGTMDGFWQSSQESLGNGDAAIGYYTERELPFYYSLLDDSALCANYFCSLLGPTWPNRFYMASGTSGGITTNGIWGYGVFDNTNYPMILDLLDEAGVTWKIYNMNLDSVPFGNTDNVFVFWTRYQHDVRTLGSRGSFLNDVRKGMLPQVSWLIPSFAHQKDEHPPADVSWAWACRRS
jgi:phospholipase C